MRARQLLPDEREARIEQARDRRERALARLDEQRARIAEITLQEQMNLDRQKWEIARALHRAYHQDGVAQKAIGAHIGRSAVYVWVWITIWDRRAEFESQGMTFSEAEAIVRGRPNSRRRRRTSNS